MNIFEAGTQFGIGFALGVLQALLVGLLVLWLIRSVVNHIWGLFTFSKYKLKNLPSHYKSLELNYHVTSKLLVATATFTVGGSTITRYKAIHYTKECHTDEFATSLQLSLMREIAEEFPHDDSVTTV